MAELIEGNKKTPAIDDRILAAIERNQEYLGLQDWLGKYAGGQSKVAVTFGKHPDSGPKMRS